MARTAIAISVLVQLPFAIFASSDCKAATATDVDVVEESDSGLSALQVARASSVIEDCQGDWCDVLMSFCHLFDSNQPYTMQKAFDMYSEYASREEGIKLAVTKDHFYEMYHGNVGQKLAEFLPQRLFAWEFNNDFETMESGPTEAKIARSGTITFNLGWWRRNMFWKSVVKELPNGEVFPYSSVSKFDDCKHCPAKMVFTLKKGGLKGNSGDWKVVDLSLIKLE